MRHADRLEAPGIHYGSSSWLFGTDECDRCVAIFAFPRPNNRFPRVSWDEELGFCEFSTDDTFARGSRSSQSICMDKLKAEATILRKCEDSKQATPMVATQSVVEAVHARHCFGAA